MTRVEAKTAANHFVELMADNGYKATVRLHLHDRAECLVCGRVYTINMNGLLHKHSGVDERWCAGSYTDPFSGERRG